MIRKRLMTEINLAVMNKKDNFRSIFYSDDFQGILTNSLEQKYGGAYTSHRAAKIIQLAFRQFRLKRRLNSGQFYETKSVHYKNHSMPENLHFLNNDDDDEMHSSNECLVSSSKIYSKMRSLKSSKIKDSLSLLLPELQGISMTQSSLSESSNTETDNLPKGNILFDSCQFKVGDHLSTKCEEDLENFRNESMKADSTEDSEDSSSEKEVATSLHHHRHHPSTVVKLPPPMPVISTSILSSTKCDKVKTKMNIFSFERLDAKEDVFRCDQRPGVPPRSGVCCIQSTRSPRDSGVSSHSSNTDLLTMEGGSQVQDNGRSLFSNCSYLQRPPQSSNTNVTSKYVGLVVNQCSAPNDVILEHDSGPDSCIIPAVVEDNDSLFEMSGPGIPSIMTSSKDSGVDADGASGSVSNTSGHLRRLSFQDKPIHRKLFHHRQDGITECVLESSILQKESVSSTVLSSPWMRSNVICDNVDDQNSATSPMSGGKEIVSRVLYRVAVNLFNRNTAVGLKFMEDHHIFNVRCPMEIANFLRNREVNLQVLAEFISSRNSMFHLQVLRCYLQNMSFQNLSFLEAFDMFISSFKLPDDSSRINFLIAEFCQFYTRHVQRCSGVDLGALVGLSRIIVLLRSSVIRSRLISSSNSVLSFSDFVKNIQNCFKGQHVPYNMEMLQKIYISITRTNTESTDLAETLVNRIGNIDDCKSKAATTSTPSKSNRVNMSSNYLQQTFRRLTYCCDVQQSDPTGKKLKKNERLRSIFVFNDTIIVAKRLSKPSSKHSKLFRTDSRFQCKEIVNLLTSRVTSITRPGTSYQISISRLGEGSSRLGEGSSRPGDGSSRPGETAHNQPPMYLTCDCEMSRDKLMAKITMSQLESLCVEQLRLQQWNCVHEKHECLCVSIIEARLPKIVIPVPRKGID